MTTDISSLPKPVDLAYLRYEPESGVEHQTPIICLHGLFSCKEHWIFLDTPKRLADLSKRVVFICDVRDHSDSPQTTDFSFPGMVSDVVHFMSKHNIEKAICIGHSLGAMIFSRVATLFPHLVEKLILLDISPFPKLPKDNPVQLIIELFVKVLETVRAENLGLEAAVERANEIMTPALPEERKRMAFLMHLTTRDGKLDWKFNLPQIIEFMKDKFEEIRPKSDVEALEIYGGKSEFVNKNELEEMREYLPNLKFAVIEEADHALQLTHPNEFLSIAVPFINGETA